MTAVTFRSLRLLAQRSISRSARARPTRPTRAQTTTARARRRRPRARTRWRRCRRCRSFGQVSLSLVDWSVNRVDYAGARDQRCGGSRTCTATVAKWSSSRRSARRSGAAIRRRATTGTRTRTSCSAAAYSEVIERAGHPGRRGRGRHLRLCAAVRRADVQRRRATPGSRPACRWRRPATTVDRQCGSAQQAFNFAAALIAAGVHDVVIGGGVEHMGHIPMGVGFKWVDDVGSPVAARADGALQPRAPGPLGRDDRRPVGDPALGDGRARRSLAPAGARGPPRRGASSARRSPSRSTARPTCPTRASARTPISRRWPASSRRSSPTARSPPATRRRSPTARPRVLLMRADKAAELGVTPRAQGRRPDDGRRRPRDDAHRPDPRDAQAAGAQRR